MQIIQRQNRDQLFHEDECFSETNKSGQVGFSVLFLTGSVVQRYGYFISNGNVNIVLEYMDEGH